MNSSIKTRRTSSWKQVLFQLGLMLLLVCHNLSLFAQQAGNQGSTPSSSIRSSRSFTLDAIIVVAFALLALTAICKAVRR